jgi:hypothetical protein
MDRDRYFYGFLTWPGTAKCKSINTKRSDYLAYAKDDLLHANCRCCYNNRRLLSRFKNGVDYLNPPVFYWILAVLVIVAAMLIQGLGILLPTNIRVYFELKKSEPDMPRIQKLMRRYVKVVAIQAVSQFIIIFIMAEFATGFFLRL